jgi:hypothetical protein
VVFYAHNPHTGEIYDLGVIAAANMFASGPVKDNESTDLRDVAFSGGGHNGKLDCMSLGLRDASIGFSHLRRVQKLFVSSRGGLSIKHIPL